MIILIAGCTHTGKTLLAQKLLERLHYPYLSIDHLKMGLIRSGATVLSSEDDERLTDYLFKIVREIVKTNIENRQNLIVEGCYIPFNFVKDFTPEYLLDIHYICIIFSRDYIEKHFADILAHENDVEKRCCDSGLTAEILIRTNEYNLKMCEIYNLAYILIDEKFDIEDIVGKLNSRIFAIIQNGRLK